MTRRTRVLLVSPLPPPEGGIATWTRLVLATPPAPDIELRHANSSPRKMRHYTAPMTLARLGHQGQITVRLLWAIAATRPEVVHVTSSYDRGWARDTLVLACARAWGAATIVNLRGGDFERFYSEASPARQRRIRRDLQRCDAVVPITGETERFLLGLGLTNVQSIPNCVDIRPRAARAPRPLRRWLYVGWVMPAKGLVELLTALRGFPDAHLTLVGAPAVENGRDTNEFLADAESDPQLAGRITHVPGLATDDVRALYEDHDLFVFPTRREGFPNAILEAMESAMPIVATRVGAIPEMLENGVHGLLVEACDADALTRAIAEISAQPSRAAALGAAAFERVAQAYDVRKVVRQWGDLYRAVARTHSR